MDQYEMVRTAHRVYKKSIRQIARETGHTRRTVRKVLAGQEPKYRREKEPVCPVMDPIRISRPASTRSDSTKTVSGKPGAVHMLYSMACHSHVFGEEKYYAPLCAVLDPVRVIMRSHHTLARVASRIVGRDEF